MADTYECECIDCGHRETYEDHCADHTCPKCGGQMRRVGRPGPGQDSADASVERRTIPRSSCRLTDGRAMLLQPAEEGGKPRFRLAAYSGGIIPNHWWWGNVALDLDGMAMGRPDIPVLREHISECLVGYADRVAVEPEGLVVEGPFNLVTKDSKEVYELAKVGHPWQASIYFAEPHTIEEVSAGETAEVNGRTLTGPGTVFRKWRLREASFCTLGADENTSGRSLSDGSSVDVTVTVLSKETAMADEKVQIGKEEFERLTALDGEVTELREFVPTAAWLREKHGDVADELRQGGAADERERVVGILEGQLPGQMAVALQMVKDGTPLDEARKLLLADPDYRKEVLRLRKLDEFRQSAPPPPGPGGEEGDTQTTAAEDPFWLRVSEYQEAHDGVSRSQALKAVVKTAEGRKLHEAWLERQRQTG